MTASHNPSKSLISTRQACPRSGALSAQRRGGGWRWAEETSRLERHPTREIGKEGPRAKPSRHPRGATRKPLDPPSAFGFPRVKSHRTKPLPPAVLGVLFWDFIFSALSALEKALGQRHFFFLLRYFIRRICQARSSGSKRLPGSGCPHRWECHAPSSHRHRASKRQPNSNSDRLCRRGKKVRVTLWTLMFCFPSSNRPLSSRLHRTVSPEPGRFSASHLGGLLTPWDGSDGYRLVVERLYKTNGTPQSTRGSGKVLIP